MMAHGLTQSDPHRLAAVLLSRSEGAVAVAGGDWGGAGSADGFAAGVYAPLPQEAPLSG